MWDFFNRRIKDLFSDYIKRMNDSNDEKLFVELFYEKIKEFFVEYIDKMNNDNKSLFIEINKKRIRVNKMF